MGGNRAQGDSSVPHLAVIIVSYNVCEHLRSCLQSLFVSAAESRDHLRVDVLVVDNASVDGSVRMVADEFPQVHLIAPGKNLGFTGGNNLGLRTLGFGPQSLATEPPSLPLPDFVLLLNPDTEVVGDALLQMVAALRARPAAAACGAHLRYADGAFQHGAFRFPGLLQVALDLFPPAQVPGVRRFVPRLLDSRLNGRYPRRLWQGSSPFQVDFVLGAALMVRREIIEWVGLLDDSFFMYCEEMDWCLRMGQIGGTIWAVPTAMVTHHEAQSSRQKPWRSFERLWRSRIHFYRKHARRYPTGFLVVLRLLLRLGLAVRERAARRAFRRGALLGSELGRELEAYRLLRSLIR